MREKLNALIYVLLRDSLTISDMERIVEEVEAGVKPDSLLLSMATEHIADRLFKSINPKCSENMCNTEHDDVKMVRTVIYSGHGINARQDVVEVAMCADCRRRNPEAVVI